MPYGRVHEGNLDVLNLPCISYKDDDFCLDGFSKMGEAQAPLLDILVQGTDFVHVHVLPGLPVCVFAQRPQVEGIASCVVR